MNQLNPLTQEALSVIHAIYEDHQEDRYAYRNEIHRLTASGLSNAFGSLEHFLDRYGYISIDQRHDALHLTSSGLAAAQGDANRLKSLNDDIQYHFAKEIAEEKITGTVIASSDELLINDVKETLSSETFKIYSSDDIQGVELAGALKNIYAIICGIAESLKVGENAVGLILTRSMAEMSRFAVAKGANPITFLGLAGMGDLVATCTSNLSRNFQLGLHLGEGLNLDEAKSNVGQVAEGIRTLEVIKAESANLNISMPLVDSLYNIVFNGASSKTFIDDLVNNPHEVDVEFTY